MDELTERQQKVLALIRKRGDEGTSARDVASLIKDDIHSGRNACERLVRKGLVFKKTTFGIVSSNRPYNNRRTQKLAMYFPMAIRETK